MREKEEIMGLKGVLVGGVYNKGEGVRGHSVALSLALIKRPHARNHGMFRRPL